MPAGGVEESSLDWEEPMTEQVSKREEREKDSLEKTTGKSFSVRKLETLREDPGGIPAAGGFQ